MAAVTVIVRSARRSDLPAIYRLLDRAFVDAPRSLFVRQTEGDSTMRLRDIRIAADRAGLLAHVRIFRRAMLVRGAPVRSRGIGSVASASRARGNGHPSALLRDAHDEMRRDGVGLAFLFTGIPAFYERLGYRVLHQPTFEAHPREADALAFDTRYRIQRLADASVAAVSRIYQAATTGTTGAIVRSPRTWRDAQRWLGEDRGGALIASREGAPVAYIRARVRDYGYVILETEHVPGEEAAIAPLLRRVARRAASLDRSIQSLAPEDHALAALLRSLPATRETATTGYPMMARVVSLHDLVAALTPVLRSAAHLHPGPPFSLEFAADDQRVTLAVGARSAARSSAAPTYRLDSAATLDIILGQRRASEAARPQPSASVRARLDAMLPPVALHFWNTDRI